MVPVWIVHREPRLREALARLAGAPADAVSAAPGDPAFDEAPPTDVVVLGLSGDFEAELQFAHRTARRLHGASWVVVAERDGLARAERLFDTLDADWLPFPPDARLLRERIRAARERGRDPLPLSQRPARDELRERFTRWFADLDLPALLRAVDPRLADVPLLVLGEPGTGRELLARYVHAFGGEPGAGCTVVPCAATRTRDELLERIAPGRTGTRGHRAATVVLGEVDRLDPALQREVLGWIEFGAPAEAPLAEGVRWIGTALDDAPGGALDSRLAQALAGLRLCIPPLRERPRAVAPFAEATARRWLGRRGLAPRPLGEDVISALEQYPWPGNLRELEAVVESTLAAGQVSAADLPFGSLEADAVAFRPEEPAEPAAEEPEEAEAADVPEAPEPAGDGDLRRLAAALAHEVRNPLTAIRTFAALLPERYGDSEFRQHFSELVGERAGRIEDVVARLERMGSLPPPHVTEVDVRELLDELLRERRDLIRRRRLLVLKELDTENPHARADADQLRFAFEAVLNKALELVPERGDLYCASRYHPDGLQDRASLRVLLRFHGAPGTGAAAADGLDPAQNALEFVIAEAVIRAQGGTFAVDVGEAETVVVVDLPA